MSDETFEKRIEEARAILAGALFEEKRAIDAARFGDEASVQTATEAALTLIAACCLFVDTALKFPEDTMRLHAQALRLARKTLR